MVSRMLDLIGILFNPRCVLIILYVAARSRRCAVAVHLF